MPIKRYRRSSRRNPPPKYLTPEDEARLEESEHHEIQASIIELGVAEALTGEYYPKFDTVKVCFAMLGDALTHRSCARAIREEIRKKERKREAAAEHTATKALARASHPAKGTAKK
jgi:hypothetical protein